MYPSTTFIIEDRSAITDVTVDEQVNAPLFMQVFSSNKGPEELGIYYGDEFKIFGDPNFARHGQPLLQAQRLINNGARVLAKRVVAPDSTLANLVVCAKVKSVQKQKVDEEGNPLYKTPEGEETTTPEGNEAIMVKKCQISYDLQTIANNHNDIEDFKASTLALADYDGEDGEEKTYPLFAICDNGRGVSAKKIRVTANVSGSRNKSYLSYIFSVIENSTVSESAIFTLNPDLVSSTSNLSLNAIAQTYLKEVKVYTFDTIMVDFLDTIKTYTGIEDIDNTDVLFGKDKKGKSLDVFNITGDINLSIPVGLALQSGSNGSFGNTPITSEHYTQELVKVFNGTFTNDIYDTDNIILDAILDANYPDDVKKAIESLVEFREDTFFFRDVGTGLRTEEDIIAKADLASKSKYLAVYGISYDVIDEYSKKQITVTLPYTLAKILPAHLSNKRHAPVAGQLHDFVFDEIVDGTVSFLPKIIPGKNQKDELFSKRINFVSYLNGVPVLESQYTNQEDYTGFSYINNVLATQEVVKAIRVNCPKNRYSFMEEDDLTKYEEDVQAILNKYVSNFSSLKMEYAADPIYEQNMTYYAVLYIQFKKFVQAEVFRIIAINDDDIVSDI